MAADRTLLITPGGLGNAILLSPLVARLARDGPVDILAWAPVAREYFQLVTTYGHLPFPFSTIGGEGRDEGAAGRCGALTLTVPPGTAACRAGRDDQDRGRGGEQLLQLQPELGEIFLWSEFGWRGLLRRRGGWSRAVVGAAVNPLRGGMLALASGAPIRVGENGLLYTRRVKADPARHEVERNLALAAAAGAPGSGTGLVFSGDTLDGAPALPARFVALHPGSGARLRGKRWPLDHFAAVVAGLQAEGIACVVVGDAAERDLGRVLAEAGALDLTGQLSLAQTAGVLRRAALYLGNDTGLMHLAAAVGTRCLALFGPTLEVKNRPWGDGHRVLTADLPCRPCYRNRPIECADDFACLRRITPDRVLAAAREALR